MAVVMFGVPVAVLYTTVISFPLAGADFPDAAIELKIFSTLVAVRLLVFAHVLKKQFVAGVPVQLSKNPAGNDVSDVQLYHAALKLVPLLVFINEKDVSDVQFCHAPLKNVPLLVFINGNDVSDVQFCHAPVKVTPLLVSINGNDVRDVQLTHA